jgi:Fe-Mn family superoxide dismutase
MPFELPALPYEYDALAEVIDEQTMRLHHDKHHQAYVTNVNAALEKHPEIGDTSLEALIANLDAVPEDIRTMVRNNGGGHLNHTWFWETMQPGGSVKPSETVLDELSKAFGSFEQFVALFNEAGLKQFGSGWVWLVRDKDGQLQVISTANQDNPLSQGHTPLLGNDVWEHAYYLKYQNKRADYLTAWWGVVNWDVVGKRFA